jgi:putative oxidoreductase
LRYLDRLQPLPLLGLRLVLGIIMIAHGYPKIFGGMSQHMQSVAHLGFPPWMGYFSAGTEFGGGLLLILGLFTRFVSLAMLIEMAIVIVKVHWKNGLTAPHGYQLPLALAAMAFALIFFGAGPLGLDAVVYRGVKRGKSSKA